MMHMFSSFRALVVAGGVLAGTIATGSSQSYGVLREVWTGIGGNAISDLTNNAAFPANPSADSLLTDYFEGPVDWADSYGTRLRAWLIAPVTGNYTFGIATDDNGVLFLSTDDTPAKKVTIAWVGGWAGSRQFGVEANQISSPITLTAGKRYYIEALQKEGGGGDNIAVAWQKPGDPAIVNNTVPIPASNCIPYGLTAPILTTDLTNLTVVEGGMATFQVQLARFLGAAYQWKRNGTNLPNANTALYTLAPVGLSDSGSTFSCLITNFYGKTNTATVTLTVTPDVTRPTLTAVNGPGDGDVVSVVFSEAVDPVTATNVANYTLNQGVSVLRAAVGVDAQTIILVTSPLSYGVPYTLTVSNVRDRATTPNAILPNTHQSFTLTKTPLDISLVRPAGEPLGPSTRRGPLVISELMFCPTNRPDGRNLQFIEIYNSNPWYEDIGGWRLSGAVDYAFPAGTVMQGRTFLVVAPAPADVAAVYGVNNLLGPLEGGGVLPKDSGTIRIRNKQDAIVFEMKYDSQPPYPLAAGGTGHSLVLARPSLGESDPRAWDPSDQFGGTPGTNELASPNPLRPVVLNEVLARPDTNQQGFLELFNYSTNAINLGGCVLSDDPLTNRFIIPANTSIAAGGFLAFTTPQLGFDLRQEGKTIYFKNPNAARVLDTLRLLPQLKGVAWGRSPDGSAEFNRLLAASPGSNNARVLLADVVINEIMYDPISGDDDDQYIELFNRGTNALDLSRWHVRGGISFDIPSGTTLATGGYLVIARNATNLMSHYANLSAANTLGDFSGALGHSADSVSLSLPEPDISTNEFGVLITNWLHVMICDVSYKGGGRWGLWSHGGGSSLELTDPRSNPRLAPNWADSDETSKSGWVTVSMTGVLDNGQSDANSLQIMLLGEGECLVDNVVASVQGGANLVPNPDFESGLAGWFFQGTHKRSSLETAQGYNSARCLHVRASDRGDTGANRIRIALTGAPSAGQTFTLSAKVKWLAGWPEILLRLHGGYLEATTNILTARNLGTPGAPNSRALPNAGPAITEVIHQPIVPAPGQDVTVSAHVYDPDGLSAVFLRYRLDPGTNIVTLPMVNNGAGLFSGVLPGQPDGTVAPFHLIAADASVPAANTAFPSDAPARECIVRWGDPVPSDLFGSYRFWISQRSIDEWANDDRLSNDPHDSTFVYGTNRVIYNLGALYEGSPWHAPSYNSPIGNQCDYKASIAKDDMFLNGDSMHLLLPGNGCCDNSLQKEQLAYWMVNQVGEPQTYRRHVNVFVNGQRRAYTLMEDSQRPDGDMTDEWYPNHPNSDVYKMQFWYEFDDAALTFSAVGVSLGNFTTTGGVKKLARYRWDWAKRATQTSANDYTNVYHLVDAVNTNATGDAYTAAILAQVDIDNWCRTLAVEKLVGNGDSWGNGGGQNMYGCKPPDDTWKLLIWDIDFAFSGGSATDPLFSFSDAPLQTMMNTPPFTRAYWRALYDFAYGPMMATRCNPLMDARYAAFVAAGIVPDSPDAIKTYISTRRDYVVSQLATVASPFSIATGSGQNFTTNRSVITLAGVAPVNVATLTVNDIAYSARWTTISNWSITLPLSGGVNAVAVRGYDSQGVLIPGASAALVITNTLPLEQPQNFIVINEIMFDPVAPDAEYVELYNTSTNTTFDLSGWHFSGLSFDFPPASLLGPRAFLVLAKSRAAFAAAYGSNLTVFAEYSGNLQANGETLTLLKPSVPPATDLVVAKVRYSAAPPWPTNASATGFSLQLVDASQDASRVGNWAVSAPSGDAGIWRFASISTNMGADARLFAFLNSAGDVYLDDLSLVAGTTAGVGSNFVRGGDFETPIANNFLIGTNLTNSTLSTSVKHAGNSSAHLISTAPGGLTLATLIYQTLSPAPTNRQMCTLSCWYRYGASGTTLTLRVVSTALRLDVSVTATNLANVVARTPGTNNNVTTSLPPFPPLWINEVLPVNLTGLSDASGRPKPWLELCNLGLTNVPLDGFFLSDDYSNPAKWPFPAGSVLHPREFKIVFADGQTNLTTAGEWHTSFGLTNGRGSLALSRLWAGQPLVLDYLDYALFVPDRSYGSYPDGQPYDHREFYHATPGATNDPTLPALRVLINEWMADNNHTLADPADGDHEDWFELYNPDTNAVSLAGYYLTDNLTNKLQFQIPDGYFIPARGYLLVWADGEPKQNSPIRPDLHVSFKLDAAGEAIGLFTPDGTAIDAITFGPQATDVSQGRYPDGASTIKSLTTATPGAPNAFHPPNSPPQLTPIPNAVVTEGQMLAFTVTARDSNQPAQTLTYTLDPGAPVGTSLHPQTGFFAWRPVSEQAPSTNYLTVRVTDSGTPPLSDVWSFQVVVLKLPRLAGVNLSGNQLGFSCASYPGKHYQLQYSDDLRNTVWGNFGSAVLAEDTLLNLTVNVSAPSHRFFRLLQVD